MCGASVTVCMIDIGVWCDIFNVGVGVTYWLCLWVGGHCFAVNVKAVEGRDMNNVCALKMISEAIFYYILFYFILIPLVLP